MRRLFILVAIGLVMLPAISPGAQTAQARLHCRSLRVQRGRATDTSGFLWTMDMTTLAAGVNGELAPDFLNSGYTNSTYVDLYSELLEETFPGALVVDIPSTGDA